MKYFCLLLCLALAGCGSSEDRELKPYREYSAYKDNLVECSQSYHDDESCYLSTLPPLNLSLNSVTVEQIMSRVVVTHDWMGKRFEEILRRSPQELLDLFSPITVISIGYDIRPAFYHPLTGGIYLDPIYLWMSEDEFNSIDLTPDYRSGFGNELKFIRLWRYLDSTHNRVTSYEDEFYGPRSLSEVTPSIQWLLFHELSHANDFLPPAVRTQLNASYRDKSIYDVIYESETGGKLIQTQLTTALPIVSQLLKDIARVLFRGETANALQKSYSGADIGAEFETEGASDLYGYHTNAEDLAMLFEETMMSYSLGATRDIAFVKQVENGLCDEHTIEWGQRGRIGEPEVKERAKFVVSRLLPNQAADIIRYLDELPEAETLPLGLGWCESRDSTFTPAASKFSITNSRDEEQFQKMKRYRLLD